MQQLGQEEDALPRLIMAFVLMAGIIALWQWLSPPSRPPQKAAEKVERLAPEGAPGEGEAEEKQAPEGEESTPAFTEAVEARSEQEVVLENEELRLHFTNRGGRLIHAYLKNYHEKDGGPDDLVSPVSEMLGGQPLSLATSDSAFNDSINGALFHVEQDPVDGGTQLRMRYGDGHGNGLAKTFTLPDEGFRVHMGLELFSAGASVDPVPTLWGPGFAALTAKQARNPYFQQSYVAYVSGGKFKKEKKDKKDESSRFGEESGVHWAAVSNNYFAAVFSADEPFPWIRIESRALTEEQEELYPAPSVISLEIPLPAQSTLDLTPKEWKRLSAMGDQYYRLADWGWLGPICAALLWGLKKLYIFSHNYGVAIILLTLIIKLLFFPLTHRSMVKMKEMGEAMKKLKPQIDRIKAKYKKLGSGMENKQKMNEETMALYQREGVNPMGGLGGCLPLLLQMPIFFALFTLLPRSIELRGAPFFLWIQDLSVYDPYYITPLVMGVTMFLSTRMTSTQMEGAQKAMMMFMPVMFTWFCLWAPAGLTIYWLTNNVLSIGQQALINRKFDQKKEELSKSRKSTPKKPPKPSHGKSR